MRIIYPEEMLRELRSLSKYLVFNGHENVVRDDAPEGTKERYEAIHNRMDEFRRQHVGF